jgi:glycosyltransferase involved in cell wall biosynthesis
MKNKSILIIAKDYPPSSESSGVQRILKFSQYLPELGWKVQVLTMWKKAYGKAVNDEQLKDIPNSVLVRRVFGLNTAIHLSIRGRYVSWMALPDRWASWAPFAVLTGLYAIIKNRPTILFSTYPCATAHLIALILHRVAGIAWVADFRDPMLYKNDNVKGLQYQFYLWIEKQTMKYCSLAVFTTPGAIENYAKIRYKEYSSKKWVLIANGFDEQNFVESCQVVPASRRDSSPMVLLHAGYLYRAERDPSDFFLALSNLLKRNLIAVGQLKIILRASGYEAEYGELIKNYGLQEIVELQPAIPYKQALSEMLSVDGLLLFQGSLCNHQIPAKVYEYFRALKPVFTLTDLDGDTAALLHEAGMTNMAPMNDAEKIASEFLVFYEWLKVGNAPIPNQEFVNNQSRFSRAQELSNLLESILIDL